MKIQYLFCFFLLFLLFSCGKDEMAPAEVSSLTIRPGASEITLTWIDPADDDFNKIEILYDQKMVEVEKNVGTVTIRNLINNQLYLFSVRTIDKNGNKSDGIQIQGSPDYRLRFVGEFSFTTICQNWMMGQPTSYDTIYYDGSIHTYQEGDSLKDLSTFDNPGEQSAHKITIGFMSSTFITPEITDTGLFLNKSGYHYSHSGFYITSDTVEFQVGGLGGLGGGTNYRTYGIRK